MDVIAYRCKTEGHIDYVAFAAIRLTLWNLGNSIMLGYTNVE